MPVTLTKTVSRSHRRNLALRTHAFRTHRRQLIKKMGWTKEQANNFIDDRLACQDHRFGNMRQILFGFLVHLGSNGVTLSGYSHDVEHKVLNKMVKEYDSLIGN